MQTRYYDPAIGRFINADSYASTGQGVIGYNMFAYCRNNPSGRMDNTGTLDFDCNDENDILLGNNISGRASGGTGFWSDFTRSMKYAAKGLSMAAGNRNFNVSEDHHILSNKNKTYTPQFQEVTDRYDMSLDSEVNIIELQGHHGRHTNAYHIFMLTSLNNLDAIANGDPQVFYEGFALIVDFLAENPWLPYAR